jgi:hypothetical protein
MVAIPHLDPWLAIAVIARGCRLPASSPAADERRSMRLARAAVQQEKGGDRRAAIVLRLIGDRASG